MRVRTAERPGVNVIVTEVRQVRTGQIMDGLECMEEGLKVYVVSDGCSCLCADVYS